MHLNKENAKDRLTIFFIEMQKFSGFFTPKCSTWNIRFQLSGIAMRKNLAQKALFTSRETKKPRKKFGVLDIETNGLGGPFIAGAVIVEGDQSPIFYNDLDLLLVILFSPIYKGVIWYGHNLAEYDLKYLLLHIRARKDISVECSLRGNKITWTKLRKGKAVVELRDSLHLMQMKLEKIGELFSHAKKGKIDFTKEIFDLGNARHREYLTNDVVVLLQALCTLDNIIFTQFQTHLHATMASTSLACFRTTIDRSEIYWRNTPEVETFIRGDKEKVEPGGYFGGLVFLREHEWIDDCVHVDFNAHYADAMRTGVPTGAAIYTDCEREGYKGFFRCLVRAPAELPFTFLPYRETRGLSGSGVCYPTGEFETISDSDTISFARSVGYDITVIDGFVWEKIAPIFEDFLLQCESLELSHKDAQGKPDAVASAMKLVRNSCYGIFGLNPIGEKLVMSYDDEDLPLTHLIDEDTGDILWGLYKEESDIEAGYIMPHWAAWITAHARLKLAQTVYAVGPESVVYGDTDSLVIKHNAFQKAFRSGKLDIGPAYGQLKIEARYLSFRAFAPKNYCAITADGLPKSRAKGIPKPLLFAQLASVKRKVNTTYQSMPSTVVLMKHPSMALVRKAERGYSMIEHSYAWRLTEGGHVRPVSIQELSG